MGGASKLLSSLLLTSSPLRLRPSAGAFALFLSPPASRRHLLLSSPAPHRTLSTASASAAAGGASSDSYSSGSCHSPFPEWSRLVDRLSAAGYGARAPSPADELDLDPECGLSSDAEAAVSSFLAFARDRPDLLRSLPRKDVEVLVANAAPALFKDGEASELRLRQYLAGEGSDVSSFPVFFFFKLAPLLNGLLVLVAVDFTSMWSSVLLMMILVSLSYCISTSFQMHSFFFLVSPGLY